MTMLFLWVFLSSINGGFWRVLAHYGGFLRVVFLRARLKIPFSYISAQQP